LRREVKSRVVDDAEEQPGLLPKLRVTSPEAILIRKTLFSEVRTTPNCDWEIVAKVERDVWTWGARKGTTD
jgi:hypothetical protein